MDWLYISILAYLLLGIAGLGDKLVVTKYLSSPKVYAVSVALLQSVVVLLLIFFWDFPGWLGLGLDFLIGISFVFAIYFLYTALKSGEASGIVPAIDAIVPIIILSFSFLFLSKNLDIDQIKAILLLIGGGFLLAWSGEKKHKKVLFYIVLSAIFFATSQLLSDFVYTQQPFVSAFAWSRLGGVLTVVPFLFFSKNRKELKNNFSGKGQSGSSKAVVVAQLCGGVGFFLQNLAIDLGDLSVVSALQGIKYIFLFILIILFSKKFTQLKEDWSGGVVLRKVCGVALVLVGLVFLVNF